MIKIFFKLKKKTIFDPFPQFRGAKNIFPKNLAHIDQVFQYKAEIQRNLMIQLQENNPTESRMEGRTDPFMVPFQLLLKVQQVQLQQTTIKKSDIEQNVGLTKNCCLTVIMQKNQLNSQIHSLDKAGFRVSKLNGHAHF